ncbi:MAG: histidine phosphatase family protein [Chloroflexi bacterium]|nr:histidine phosphatase family protein [Chloroflexota bacterium]
MARWLLVRHGETSWNRQGRIQGHTDIPLDDAGIAQVQKLAARLAAASLTVAYASDLARAMDTARLLTAGHVIPLTPAPELRELCYGRWEGLTYAQVEMSGSADYPRVLSGDLTAAAPGGESVEQLLERVRAFYRWIQASLPQEGDTLVVGHGGSLRALLLHLMGLPREWFWRFSLAPASLSIVSRYGDDAVLDLWNDTSHLGGAHVP